MKDNHSHGDVSRRRWLKGLVTLAAAGRMTACSPETGEPETKEGGAVATVAEEKTIDDTELKAAVEPVRQLMAAWNARDLRARRKFLHYPAVRLLQDGGVHVLHSPDEPGPRWEEQGITFDNRFDKLTESTGWDHTEIDELRVLYASENKVVVLSKFSRYRKDGSKIRSYEGIRIVTKENGHWGVKVR